MRLIIRTLRLAAELRPTSSSVIRFFSIRGRAGEESEWLSLASGTTVNESLLAVTLVYAIFASQSS